MLLDVLGFFRSPRDPLRNIRLAEMSFRALPWVYAPLVGAPNHTLVLCPEEPAEGTFGAAWRQFVLSTGTTVTEYDRTLLSLWTGLSPIGQALLQRHDLLHTVLGRGTSMEDELFVQGVVVGTGAPDGFAAMTAMFLPAIVFVEQNPGLIRAWRAGVEEGRRWDALARLPLEEWLDRPLEEVRSHLRR